jgi:hypothetical protein
MARPPAVCFAGGSEAIVTRHVLTDMAAQGRPTAECVVNDRAAVNIRL